MTTGLTVKSLTFLVAAVAAAVLLSGCGRAGDPLKPSQAAIERAKAEKLPPPEAPASNTENQDKRFILDGLLE